jgi:signal transduction histidine kinase/ActR/RegA family two-component response regulator
VGGANVSTSTAGTLAPRSSSIVQMGLAIAGACLGLAGAALMLVFWELHHVHANGRALLDLNNTEAQVAELLLGLDEATAAAGETARAATPEARVHFEQAAARALASARALAFGPVSQPALLAQTAARLEALRTGHPSAGGEGAGASDLATAIAETRAALHRQLEAQLRRDQAWRNEVFAATVGMSLVAFLGVIGVAAWGWAASRRQYEAQAALLRAQEAVARSERGKGRFLQAIGHDLGQPLQAIELFVTGLERTSMEPEAAELLSGVRRAVASLRRMLRGLIDISRLDAGLIAAQCNTFPLDEVLAPLAAEFGALATAQGLRFVMERSGVQVESDPVLLESILRNLIANAIRYTLQGSVALTCRIEAGKAVIAVTDTGPGIPEEELGRIFNEFYRVPGAVRTADGLGLGLAIVRRMAGLLGVGIRVRSRPGMGSTFEVALPLAAAPVRLAGVEAAPVPPEARAAALAGRRVLLVDDDVTILQALARELEAWGLAVIGAASPGEACALFGGMSPPAVDLVLVDYDLRATMTGTELLDYLACKYGIAAPALVISGTSDPQVIQEVQNSGYPWLAKPVTTERLLQAMQDVLTAPAVAAPVSPAA